MKGSFVYNGERVKYKFTIREYINSSRGCSKITYGKLIRINIITVDSNWFYTNMLNYYNNLSEKELTEFIEKEIIKDIEFNKVSKRFQ